MNYIKFNPFLPLQEGVNELADSIFNSRIGDFLGSDFLSDELLLLDKGPGTGSAQQKQSLQNSIALIRSAQQRLFGDQLDSVRKGLNLFLKNENVNEMNLVMVEVNESVDYLASARDKVNRSLGGALSAQMKRNAKQKKKKKKKKKQQSLANVRSSAEFWRISMRLFSRSLVDMMSP